MAALARDIKLNVTDIHTTHFFQSEWPSTQKFTFTDAGILDFWISGLRLLAHLGSRYELGFGPESLVDMTTLVNDMNTEPRFLTLSGNADANDALPLAKAFLNSFVLAVRNTVAKKPESWSEGLIFKEKEARLNMLVLALEFKKSLEDIKMVPMAVSEYELSINLTKFFNQLPTSQGILGSVVKLDSSGDLTLEEPFFEAFTGSFMQKN